MRISTKGRYGLRVLIDLGIYSTNKPEKLSNIALRQGISERYLEQILSKLKKIDLVRSIQGINGGYQLTCDPQQISIKEILIEIEGDLDIGSVQQSQTLYARCVRECVWQPLEEEILKFTNDITLQQLVDEQRICL